MIQIHITKACAHLCSPPELLTAGMAKAVSVEFAFSSDWDGLTKTAVFTNGRATIDVLPAKWDGDTVTVPPEILAVAGRYARVGVYGTNASGVVLPTVWATLGKVQPAAEPSGDPSTDPTLPVWAQLQEIIGDLADLTTKAKNNLVAAINEAAKTGSGGAGSIDLRTADGYIQYSNDGGATWENLIALADLKGEKGEKGDTGATGPQGERGERGPQGETGPKGPQGETGPAGPEGPKGATGPAGPDGAPGKDGSPGKDGANGAPGQDGFSPSASVAETGTGATITITDKTGATTAEIKNGKDGAPGKAGTNGKDGAPGADGTTFTPSVSAAGDLSWTNDGGKANPAPVNLKGPQGETGPTGPQGETGPQGPTGATGPQGAPGKDYTLTAADKTEIAAEAAAAVAGTSVPAPASAAVGQIVKVKAVDAAGKITQTEAVDLPTGTDLSLGITSAAVGNIIKVKSIDANGKPTSWEPVQAEYAMLKTRYDTIVDYTFNGTSTLSTAEGLSDYILWNGCKAVWNKDAQGNPLKAVRMWGYIECTKAVTQEADLSAFKLSAACRASYFYQDTPSSWYYGDDIGNGVGTYELNDESILDSKSIPINRTTYGWCDHIARFGAVQSPANKNTWTGTLKRSFAAANVLNLTQANYYKDYIYAAMLTISPGRSDYIIPDGVRIVVVAEVIDE